MKENRRENRPEENGKKTIFNFLLRVIGLCTCLITLLAGAVIVSQPVQSLWFGVGQSLIASGLFGLIMLLQEFVRRKTDQKSWDELQAKITNLENTIEVNIEFSRLGIVHIYSGAEKKGIRKIYTNYSDASERRIEILGREVDGFVEDFLNSKDRILGKKSIESIKVLLRHPGERNCCKNIALQKRCDPDEVTRHIVRNTRSLIGISKEDPRIQVRWYKDSCQSVTISVFDDTLFVTPYLALSSHKDVATLELKSGASLFREYHDHFQHLWDNASTPDEGLCNSFEARLGQVHSHSKR